MKDKSFIEQRIDNLKEEAKMLDESISKTRDRGDFGTYRNLIKAYSDILLLIDRYDWQQKYSEYTTDEEKQIAVWEQNSDGNIRDHKVWTVK